MPDEGQLQGQENTQDVPVIAPTPDQVENMNGMALAFDDPSLVVKQEGTPPPPATGEPDASTQGAAVAATPTAPDYTSFVKETFGVDTIEDAKNQWQQLQALKTAPPATAEKLKFANEQSEKVFALLQEGKLAEVGEVLSKQKRISEMASAEVTKDSAGNIIKLGIEIKNPKLSDTEIEFQYREDYLPSKEPVQRKMEDDDEFEERLSEWKERAEKLETKRVIAAKMIQPELEAAKINILFPEISKANPVVDKDYDDYKASLQKDIDFENTVIKPAITSLSDEKVKISIAVDDANNQMQFGLSLVPDKTDFDAAKQDAINFDKFVSSINYDKDGNFTPDKLALAILKIKHFDKYVQSAARQAVNAERARVIAKEAPNGNGSRDFNVSGDKTELQKQMDFALS